MNRIALASVAALLATSSFALAQDRGQDRGGFAHLDRDGNGIVTREEFRASALAHFDEIDQDHDGRVIPAEMAAFAKDQAAKRFAREDKNGDGQLSRAEAAPMPDEVFARLDANKDGQLSPEELAKADEHFQKFAEMRFAREDKNHDGAISRDEAQAAADEHFAKLDANGDGSVTKDEMMAAHRHHGRPGPFGHGPRHGQTGEVAPPSP